MSLLVDTLVDKEKRFASDLIDTDGKKFSKNDAVYNKATGLYHKNNNWYYKEKTDKTKIVLHFTIGNILSDVAALTKSYVSVSYVVARDGTVYELFNPDYWSYHLGPYASGGNTIQSKQSVGIEISNYGPLVKDGDRLRTIYKSHYCNLAQSEHYVKSSHRGFDYYAKFTCKQYDSVKGLLRFLTERYDIPYVFPNESQREEYQRITPGPGIWSHQNFRKDKTDIGPALEWKRLM